MIIPILYRFVNIYIHIFWGFGLDRVKSHHFFRPQDQIQPELGKLSGDLFWEHFERRYGVNPVWGPGVLVGGYDKMGEVDAEG